MDKIQVHVKCPFCRQSLMDEENRIDDFPSIKAVIQYGDKLGLLHLSSIYGNYHIDSEIYVPADEIVLFFCPSCHSSLLTKTLCDRCYAPMAFFELRSGGKVEICSRLGCKEHFIEFSDLSQEISAFYNLYEVFANPSVKNK